MQTVISQENHQEYLPEKGRRERACFRLASASRSVTREIADFAASQIRGTIEEAGVATGNFLRMFNQPP